MRRGIGIFGSGEVIGGVLTGRNAAGQQALHTGWKGRTDVGQERKGGRRRGMHWGISVEDGWSAAGQRALCTG